MANSYGCLAQSPQENLDKYRAYRARFLGTDGGGGFISLGINAGESLPATGRSWERSCESDWHVVNHHCNATQGKGLIKWSDGTVYLGHYIAVLVLEIIHLQQDSQNADASTRELWLALNALNRLDSIAETFLGLPPAPNGFFIRDDVPPDFYLKEGKPRFQSQNPDVYCRCVLSDASCGEILPEKGRFTSQDQTLSLLMGLALVVERLPLAHYQGESLRDKAQLLAHRLVSFLQKNKWRVRPPIPDSHIPNHWGGDARGFSFALAKAAERICGNRFQNSYQTGFSRSLGRLSWGFIKAFFPFFKGRNATMIFQAAMLSRRWTAPAFARRSRIADQSVYAIVDAVLNRRALAPNFPTAEFEEILNTAPLTGACFGTADCAAPDGWKAQDRWWHCWHKNGNPYGVHFQYSGLDYMLAWLAQAVNQGDTGN